MQKYKFKARNADNKTLRGILVAKDADELREIIANYDYFLIKYKKVPQSSQMFGFLEKLKIDDLTLFCRQFSFMIGAGIELDDALANLRDNTRSRKLRKILVDIYHHLMEGNSLAESFALFPKTFPRFFINMIAIGEASGNMDFVLKRLADYYESDAKTKKEIKRSTFYPKILLVLTGGLLMGISVFMMPVFNDLFRQFEADLPPLTVTVNNVTTFVRINILMILAGMMMAFIAFYIFKQTKWGRKLFDYLSLNLPVVRDVTVYGTTVRFANGFGVLIESGGKIIDSLEIIGRLLGNAIVEEKFKLVASEIKRGKPIAQSIEMIDLFPSMLIEMLRVGEESDSISQGLDKTATYFDDQVNAAVARMTAMIGPLFVLVIGGMILVVLLSIFGPMMGIMETIGQTVG